MKKKTIICHIPRADIFRDFSLAVELSDDLVLLEHCTDLSQLKTKANVKRPTYMVVYEEDGNKLFEIATNLKSAHVPTIGITAIPEDAPSFEAAAYTNYVFGAYFITDAQRHDFTSMAKDLSVMKSVFDTVPYEKPKAAKEQSSDKQQQSAQAQAANITLYDGSIIPESEVIEADFTVIYEKPELKKQKRSEEEEQRQREKNEELQAKLRKKYNISDEYSVIIEKKSFLEYLTYIFIQAGRTLWNIILIALCAYAILCLIYPAPRTEGIKIITETVEQIKQLVGL